jgi:hypothetical protein
MAENAETKERWAHIVRFYSDLVKNEGWEFVTPMIGLTRWAADQHFAHTLFPGTSLARLCVHTRPGYNPDIPFFSVGAVENGERIEFHLLKQVGTELRNEQCEVAQAHTMFREYVGWLAITSQSLTADPSWLTSTVVALAEGIHQERAFDRLPILADALQDAGCDNDDILNHCRQPGEHVRGCWVVDLLTGRRRFPIRITAETVANIKRAVGEDGVFVSYHQWQPQTLNEGYNVLLGLDKPPGKFDEVPLDHLIGQVVPVYESGVVVLSCFPGGFAYIGPDGEFLQMQDELSSDSPPSAP